MLLHWKYYYYYYYYYFKSSSKQLGVLIPRSSLHGKGGRKSEAIERGGSWKVEGRHFWTGPSLSYVSWHCSVIGGLGSVTTLSRFPSWLPHSPTTWSWAILFNLNEENSNNISLMGWF